MVSQGEKGPPDPWRPCALSLLPAPCSPFCPQGEESKDLHCPTHRQVFSPLHNNREHLPGKQHLQTLTGESLVCAEER